MRTTTGRRSGDDAPAEAMASFQRQRVTPQRSGSAQASRSRLLLLPTETCLIITDRLTFFFSPPQVLCRRASRHTSNLQGLVPLASRDAPRPPAGLRAARPPGDPLNTRVACPAFPRVPRPAPAPPRSPHGGGPTPCFAAAPSPPAPAQQSRFPGGRHSYSADGDAGHPDQPRNDRGTHSPAQPIGGGGGGGGGGRGTRSTLDVRGRHDAGGVGAKRAVDRSVGEASEREPASQARVAPGQVPARRRVRGGVCDRRNRWHVLPHRRALEEDRRGGGGRPRGTGAGATGAQGDGAGDTGRTGARPGDS